MRAALGGARRARWAGVWLWPTLLLAVSLWFAEAAVADGRPTVTAARSWAHATYTRFVLELSRQVEYRLFTLPDPNRMVLDFPELEFAIPESAGAAGGATGLVAGFRFGLFDVGNSRLVLDLSGPARIKRLFVLPPLEGKPYRLVLDLEPATEAEFRKTASQGAGAPARPSTGDTAAAVSPGPSAGDGKFVVVIDAGHGGVDPGAIGPGGMYEKRIALAAAKELAARLESLGRYRVKLTRDRDIFRRLRERVAIGRRVGADLFLSLHADSIADAKIRGAHVYSLSETASDREAAALAAKENKADIIAGVDLAAQEPGVSGILLDLAQRETKNFSAEIANILVSEFRDRGLAVLRKPHRQAGFRVLKAPDVPSVLIELGFLSNRDDSAMLRGGKGRMPLIHGIAHAVDRFFEIRTARRF
ncbi:MAG: N-acetylmuramoyl-L-alanine amidase [Alphaproteobacteria bacterium]|jgi:N-acetylmuramoyl-L-alanine amidase|nr:N-acetylmuramoyl-L-alanine amidase [Alphaproteobacteria bacterium]MDP6516897.1 N-acetylmuramoyl-L-alanine amidase [Alphaproteobacteria bacterium]